MKEYVMQKLLALVAAAGLLLALGASAEARNGRVGGGSANFIPPGINGNSHLESFPTSTTNSTPPVFRPDGWDSGKADWKQSITNTTTGTITPPVPPGLKGH